MRGVYQLTNKQRKIANSPDCIPSCNVRSLSLTALEVPTCEGVNSTYLSHYQVLLAAVSLFWLHSSQAVAPHLLISKIILNEYTVEGKDLTIQYSLYNVGEG